MKKMAIFVAVSACVVAFTSSANASFVACQSIADPMKRLACYDKAANAAAPSPKMAAANPVEAATSNPIPAKPIVKALSPAKSRYWVEVEGGPYGFSKNLPILAATASPALTGPTPVPTSPGFIGLVSISTVANSLATGDSPDLGGGGSFRMGYWLDPQQTRAIEGSAFYVRANSSFSPLLTTVRTSTLINTTPDVLVGLFNDTTATALNGAMTDQFYGADVNYRMRASQFANLSTFDLMFGLRYAALDEKLSASVNSVFSRNFRPELGIPVPTDFTNTVTGFDTFRIHNDFIGPQIGFNAEQHWGPYWVASENKLAVGAVIERVSVSDSTIASTTPTSTFFLAGIPLQVTGGSPVVGPGGPQFGLFAQFDRSKIAFAAVPSGNIKLGYDIVPDMLSVTLAYNYIYMSSVGRVGDQIASATDIRQSSIFAQGMTFGVKARF
jgi:Putative beta barrel porin-7 (BBP7)